MAVGTPSNKPEFPPLLAAGRHEIDFAGLRQLCVYDFPLSTTRPKIMGGLEKVIEKLRTNGVKGEIWVDGSFLTEKIDPEDVDLVLRVPADFYDNATHIQRDLVNWLASNLRDTHLCDSYFFMEWPEGHPNQRTGQYMHDYWMNQFGFSRGAEEKGIAVLSL